MLCTESAFCIFCLINDRMITDDQTCCSPASYWSSAVSSLQQTSGFPWNLQLSTAEPSEMKCPPVSKHNTWPCSRAFDPDPSLLPWRPGGSGCYLLYMSCAVLYQQAVFHWCRSVSVGTIRCNHQSRLLFSYRAFIFLLIWIFIWCICRLMLRSYALCMCSHHMSHSYLP